MIKKNIQTVAYEKYKLTWMLRQGFSLNDFIEGLTEQQNENNNINEKRNLFSAYSDWEQDTGFGNGSIWVCFEEFLDNEYQDRTFMHSILTEGEFRTYLEDIGDGWQPFNETMQLLMEAVQKEVLNHAKAGNNGEDLLIGIARTTGWYYEPITQIARELMYDKEGRDIIRAAISEKDHIEKSIHYGS